MSFIYVIRELHWSPVALAVAIGCASVGGALAGRRLARPRGTWWGVGPLLLCALALQPLILVPVLFAGPGLLWQIIIGVCVTVRFAGTTAHGSTQRSVRQSMCDPRYQGRQQSIGTWVTFGPRFLSALATGALVSVIGLGPSMAVAATATAGGFLVLARSPSGAFGPCRQPVRGEVALSPCRVNPLRPACYRHTLTPSTVSSHGKTHRNRTRPRRTL